MLKRRMALITGWSLVCMTILAAISIGYAFGAFNHSDQDALKENFLSNQALYLVMLIGIFLILVLDLVVSYTLYFYFKEDNKKLSLSAAGIRGLYTLIFGAAAVYLARNLFMADLSNETIYANFQSFQSIWDGSLILFGFHLVLIGILMKLHKRIPAILWFITLFAGLSYVILHLLKVTFPEAGYVATLGMILALPMTIGELGLAIWLLVKGGKMDPN